MKTTLAAIVTPFVYLFIIFVSIFRTIPMSWQASKTLFKVKATILAAFLSLSAMAQPPLTAKNFDPSATYLYIRDLGSYVHPEGYPVTLIVVARKPFGDMYAVPMRSEDTGRLETGCEVLIFPSTLP